MLYAKFCCTSKCHSSAHILLYFPFDLFLLAAMPTHSLRHQITSHAISLTILWPEYLAQVSASSLNLPSTLSPYSSICWWKWVLLCIVFTSGSNSAVCFFHKFQSNFYLLFFHRQRLSEEHERVHTLSQLFSLKPLCLLTPDKVKYYSFHRFINKYSTGNKVSVGFLSEVTHVCLDYITASRLVILQWIEQNNYRRNRNICTVSVPAIIIYIYIYTHTHIYVYIYLCMYIYVFVYIYIKLSLTLH